MTPRLIATILLGLFLPQVVSAQQNQFWLAAQHDWGAKKGFFLTLNGQSSNGAPAALENVKLELGIGDGTTWRFISVPGKWELHKPYAAKAAFAPGSVELWLGDQRVGHELAKLVPVDQPMAVNEQPSFLRGPANYIVRQMRLIARSAGETIDEKTDASSLPVQLTLFNPAAGAQRKSFTPGDRFTIEATFRFEPAPDLRALAPFIDRYGQSIHADWPGKVRKDEDLLAAQREEDERLKQWGQPENRDPFGGVIGAPFSEQPTGFFRVTRHDDRWWLITPMGNPCFYVGLSDAPALDWEPTPATGREFLFQWLPDGDFARAWTTNPWHRPEEQEQKYIAFHTTNLIRKYGPKDWEARATTSALARAKALGFSGYGKWCGQPKDVPHAPVLYHHEVPNLVRHPDIFDPAVRQRFAENLRRQIEPRKDDPYVIGWSVGNEFDECIAAADVSKILAMGRDVPAKQELIAHALKNIYSGDEGKLRIAWSIPEDVKDLSDSAPKPPGPDIETLRRFYASAYYDFIYKTVKSIDTNHLYLGFWVTPNWWENDADWDLMASHCDVIGYDFYARSFTAAPIKALLERHDKPAICGEFSCPPDYDGTCGSGRYHIYSRDDREAGQIYGHWLADAAKHPRCVGVFYFQYRDQPLTGRGPVTGPIDLVIGEHFAFGIVDVTDRLKWPFVQQVRAANLTAASARFE